ncbi:polymeric immunoglobulin receptor-like [Chanos chanos]|uniref:polymeric immunoglobulin receptor-like n=1 Tax=Chanos chanos TaxID=29144 RepID=UPI0011F2BE14|nr:polymeric immunoglobulin receptor-like [Chanos chanos]
MPFGWARPTVTVKTGESVTIPCDYNKQYEQHRKYWCRGSAFNYCSTKYANLTSHKWSVMDKPSEHLFTVTVRDLQSGDSDLYWCCVEIGNYFQPDYKMDLYLEVQSDPDLSVVNSTVSVVEGGNASVQCLYSQSYKHKEKKWCRFKDWNCEIVGKREISQSSSVHVSDDGKGSLNVLMTGVKTDDSGWYWCVVGDLRVPVHISLNRKNLDPDLSVVNSTVSVVEGGNASVQCLYSQSYKHKEKKWCRFKDWNCEIVGKQEISQSSSVHVSDDGKGSLNVLMTGVKTDDSGWYWCAVGDLQVPVYFNKELNLQLVRDMQRTSVPL